MAELFETSVVVDGSEAVRELWTKVALYLKRKVTPDADYTLVRLAVPIRRINILSWLQRQRAGTKAYWRDRDGNFEIAGIGTAEFALSPEDLQWSVLHEQDIPFLPDQVASARYFGGMSFARQENRSIAPEWERFGSAYFFIPRIELIACGDSTYLVANLCHELMSKEYGENLKRLLASLRWNHFEQPHIAPMMSRTEVCSQRLWRDSVESALAAIKSTELQKIVLARQSICRFASQVDPWHLLRKLRAANRNCYLFGMQVADGHTFVGASPERLYKRTETMIESEAVAGTRPRGATVEEDALLAEELLHSQKDRHEHKLVVDSLAESLYPVTRSLTIDDQPSLLQLPKVQHLIVKIKGELAHTFSDDLLLASLHPTPAVGGYPRFRAQEKIRQLEPFDRGWYAGPIGWVGPEGADFAVGIRSALVQENVVRLYSGAGIVEGSEPDSEWNEIEHKLSTFVSIMTTP